MDFFFAIDLNVELLGNLIYQNSKTYLICHTGLGNCVIILVRHCELLQGARQSL